MLVLDETPYQDPKEILQVAPTGMAKAAGMAALKLPVDVAAAATIVAGGVDELVFGRDNFFKLYDEEIKPIQDRLTPDPGSVSTAGRFVAGIAGFAPALLTGPAAIPILAGQAAINEGANLVEQGVDAKTATGAGVMVGASTVAMAGIPAAGKTWGKTFALAALNPVIGAASTEAEKKLLEAGGYEGVAKQYDPLDPVARGIDTVLGVAFGSVAKYGQARREMLTKTKDSIDTIQNWQRMFKDTPFDIADPKSTDLGFKAMQKALADISEGKPVDLSGVVPDNVKVADPTAPVRQETHEARQAVAESLAQDAKLQEHRIDRNLREHVQQLMDTGNFDAVMDLVYLDPLTRTYNQKGWKRLENAGDLEGIAQGKSDLKKFKYLNDTYGDAFGDEVIATSGKYLAEQPNVKVFRIGGDETAVVSTRNNVQDVIDAYENANRKMMEHPFTGKKKDGTLVDIKGVDLVYGTGQSPTESAASRGANKQRLIDAKQYATGRGDKSLSLVERPREARPDVPSAVKPVTEVVPAPGAATGPKYPKEVLPITDSQRLSLERVLDYIAQGEAPIRRQTDYDEATARGETPIGPWQRFEPNPFPDYFKGKGYKKKETIGWIAKALSGEPLTEKQRGVVQDLMQEHRAKIARQFMDARSEMRGYGDLWNDPSVQYVEQRLAEGADIPIRTGTDMDGAPIHVSARDFLEQAKQDYKALESQKDIYQRISDCL